MKVPLKMCSAVAIHGKAGMSTDCETWAKFNVRPIDVEMFNWQRRGVADLEYGPQLAVTDVRAENVAVVGDYGERLAHCDHKPVLRVVADLGSAKLHHRVKFMQEVSRSPDCSTERTLGGADIRPEQVARSSNDGDRVA